MSNLDLLLLGSSPIDHISAVTDSPLSTSPPTKKRNDHMSRMGRKAAMLLLSAASATSLATAGSAYAASPPNSVELTVCNRGSQYATLVRPSGINQDGREISGYSIEHDIRAGSCHKFTNWWWKKGNEITWSYSVAISPGLGEGRRGGCHVPANWGPAGVQCAL